MNLVFKDRFNRKHISTSNYFAIGYEESSKHSTFSRNNLPSSFWIDGDIWWNDLRNYRHCTTGPAIVAISCNWHYYLNGKKVTRMEVLMS